MNWIYDNKKQCYVFEEGGMIPKYQKAGILKQIYYWRSPKYSGTFKEAFAQAYSNKDEDFWWNGNIYSTKLASDSPSQPSSQTPKVLDLGETISSKQREEINNMWNYLTSVKKLSPRNASAIMGNVWQESRFDDTKVSSKGATGFLQFLGSREKDYRNWLAANPNASKKYGQLDYILYAINNTTNVHDLYRAGYEKSKEMISKTRKVYDESRGKNRVARGQDYDNAVKYHNDTYGDREKNGRLYFFEGLRNDMNNPSLSTDSLTTLWHHTVERSNPSEANIPERIRAANIFYNYFGK